ncbi:Rrf2 family transcriptional regulator [Bdellovibrio sp. SKB1291214]|uniref:RrF2 family transcriptional regulator n=1 Tax=Bdellovibrio sp. SKB1291214 TaxID=1732569 RepID=UPI000B5178BF|nr:Rrf2 family transcriptional regulator [Bdellovibrio sp. SKB1291214]UYL07218.1 Rrf2 family transcriptional regulator [Bdellovibrio sp. SKB1291214]
MILGNQVEWALHCVMILASAPKGKLLNSKALADFHGVPKEYLSKCLQMLSQAGLVKTTTGPYGGYSLAKAPAEISFLDVVEAVEGKTKTFKCNEIRRNNPCLAKSDRKFTKLCDIAKVMHEADEAWRRSLRERKLSDITNYLADGVSKETISNFTEWLEEN